MNRVRVWRSEDLLLNQAPRPVKINRVPYQRPQPVQRPASPAPAKAAPSAPQQPKPQPKPAQKPPVPEVVLAQNRQQAARTRLPEGHPPEVFWHVTRVHPEQRRAIPQPLRPGQSRVLFVYIPKARFYRLEDARAEAQRLADGNGTEFVVLGPVETVRPQKQQGAA